MIKISETNRFTIGIIQFPGSNCDQDCYRSLQRHSDADIKWIWHHDKTLPKIDALVIPGGFSYGDYLRAGGLAARSPIINAVKKYADSGGPIIGICNGFQILTETRLLPGTLLKNGASQFICETSSLLFNEKSKLWNHDAPKTALRIPIAHGEGRYYIDQSGLEHIQSNDQIYLRYENNPNGSIEDIAGISNESGRIIGMMPHPERACDAEVGSADGLHIWRNFLEVSCGS